MQRLMVSSNGGAGQRTNLQIAKGGIRIHHSHAHRTVSQMAIAKGDCRTFVVEHSQFVSLHPDCQSLWLADVDLCLGSCQL
ncbi:MAG: hypothetical protein ACK56U_04720, partial [Planctomyces sp.]